MEPRLADDLKNSIYDGMSANAFATLTGGVFLTGFAMSLGMNVFMIGLVASMPFLVTVFQVPASYLAEKTGKRKQISYWAAALYRVIWIPVLIVALLPLSRVSLKSWIILSLLFPSYILLSLLAKCHGFPGCMSLFPKGYAGVFLEPEICSVA